MKGLSLLGFVNRRYEVRLHVYGSCTEKPSRPKALRVRVRRVLDLDWAACPVGLVLAAVVYRARFVRSSAPELATVVEGDLWAAGAAAFCQAF